MKRIVVIGGGITGLAATHRLLEHSRKTAKPLEIVLLEASGRLGGVIQTEARDGFLLEHGPDSFLSEKPETVTLARRLGLAAHLQETSPSYRRSFIAQGNRLNPLPEGFNLLAPARLWPFVKSDLVSWSGKARMALDLVLPRSRTNGDESLAAFVRRRFGQQALQRIAQPMIGGIYTADPEQLSLRATMPRFLEMERRDRSLILSLRKQAQKDKAPVVETSGARYSLFLTFDRGMQLLVDRLATELAPQSIRLHSRVDALARDPETANWVVKYSGKTLLAQSVCIALPAPAAAGLVRDVDRSLAAELGAIPYASTATINLAYKRQDISHPLDGFGFVVPFVERRALLACTFSSIKFANRSPDGFVLLRAFVGGSLQPEMLAHDDLEMTRRVVADLEDLLGVRKVPLFNQVARWESSMPQYHVGHLDRVERIESRVRVLPNFALAGNAYRGVGISDCIREGERAADAIFAYDGAE